MDKKSLLILGMHRSGTSALTGTLSIIGCEAPKTLIPRSATNPKGHWESDVLLRTNDALLTSAGTQWHDWTPFYPGWYRSPQAQAFSRRLLADLEAEFGDSPLFAVKDPRICRFAALWLNALRAFGSDPLPVHAHRNPAEVARSLHVRNQIEPSYGLLLWLRHVLDAEHTTRGLRRVFVSYDQLLEDWACVVGRIEDAFDIAFPRRAACISAEVERFLEPGLRHHSESANRQPRSDGLPDWIKTTFAIFERWSTSGEDSADHATLDEVRAALDATVPVFAPVVSNAIDLRARAQGAETAQTRVAELEAELAGRTTHFEKQKQEITLLETAHKDALAAQTKVLELKKAAEERAAARDAEAQEARSKHEEAQRLLDARFKELQLLTSKLLKSEKALGESEALRAKAKRATRLEAKLNEAKEKQSANQAELEKQLSQARAMQLAAERRYHELQQSTFWRLTGPARKTLSLLRRR